MWLRRWFSRYQYRPNIVTIHVYLPEERVDCWFPVHAEHLGGDRYCILDEAPDDPVWEFRKGDIVRCRFQKLEAGVTFEDKLVAYERAD
jgi:hypothetical protein